MGKGVTKNQHYPISQKIKLVVCISIIAMSSAWPVRASSVTNVFVIEIHSNLNYPGYAFVRIDSLPNDPPTCSSNPFYSFVLDANSDSGKLLYNLLLTAFAASSPLDITGYGSCAMVAGIESMKTVSLKK